MALCQFQKSLDNAIGMSLICRALQTEIMHDPRLRPAARDWIRFSEVSKVSFGESHEMRIGWLHSDKNYSNMMVTNPENSERNVSAF
jgi:hypothetical protein